MRNPLPRLSIGLPVYNGEKFIKQAIDCLLAQTFADFELIISDNASTDKTEAICRAYAAEDERIRYYRNEKNIGCACNFNRVFELSRGEYFKWAAYDDLHAPDFIEKCVDFLDNNPKFILCHSLTYFIDEQGNFLQNYDIRLNADSPKTYKRFHDLLTKHLCYPIYGVIRASALRMIPPMGSYGASDAILLLRLGLVGRFYEIPKYLFFARSHSQQSLSLYFPDYLSSCNQNNSPKSLGKMPDFYGYAVWFDSANAGKVLFPYWRIAKETVLSVQNANLHWYERLLCYISMQKRWGEMEYMLIKDLRVAAQSYLKNLKALSRLKKHLRSVKSFLATAFLSLKSKKYL